MKNRLMAFMLTAVLSASVFAPAASADSPLSDAEGTEYLRPAGITVFAAKSLNSVMEELIKEYNKIHPEITITGSYDSSGTLMVQIEEGAECDVFFSAAVKQMDELETKELIVPETREDIVKNQVCLVTFKGSGTAVTGIDNLMDASDMALADGSVPVGKYTREALVNAGIIEGTGDNSKITAGEISEALGGIPINECANVGAVTAAVAEGSNEVGTVYYSDAFGFLDRLEIIEKIPCELTGDVIYPAAQVVNPEADKAESAAAADFVKFLKSDEAKAVFENYCFDTNVA